MATNGVVLAKRASSSPLAPPAPRRRRRPLRAGLASGHALMVLAGLATFVLVTGALRSSDQAVEIVVAAAELASGSVLDASTTTTAMLEASSPLRAALVSPQQLGSNRWVTTRRVAAGEPLVASALAPVAAPGGLRAMSLPVDPAHAAGGALVAGDRVDVISAETNGARYVVRHAEVLAVAERRSGAGFSSSPSGGFHLTVAVDAQEALALAGALRGGHVEVVRTTGAASTGTGR